MSGPGSPSSDPTYHISPSLPEPSSSERPMSASGQQPEAGSSTASQQQLELGRLSSERYPPDPKLAVGPGLATSDGGQESSPTEPMLDLKGWRKPRGNESLPEVHSSIKVPEQWHKKVLAFAGVGILVAVGYMDPVSCLQMFPSTSAQHLCHICRF